MKKLLFKIMFLLTLMVLGLVINISANADELIFKMEGCGTMKPRSIVGDVPQGVDLSDDATARQVLEKAVQFAQEKCPQPYPFGVITVSLYQKGVIAVHARNFESNALGWPNYQNYAKQKRLREEQQLEWKKRAEEQMRKYVEEQEKRRLESKKRAEEERERRGVEKAALEAARRGEEYVIKYEIGGQSKQVALWASVINCGELFPNKGVRADVPQGVDLTADATTKQILEKVAQFAQEKCPERERSRKIDVYLYQGAERHPGRYEDNYVAKSGFAVVSGDKLKEFENYYVNRAVQRKREEEQARKRAEEERAFQKLIEAGKIKQLDKFNIFLYLQGEEKTGVKFWSKSLSRTEKCLWHWYSMYVEVPSNVSLLDEKGVYDLVLTGSRIYKDSCMGERIGLVSINFIPVGYKVSPGGDLSPSLVDAKVDVQKTGIKIVSIKNYVLEAHQREKERQEVKEFVKKNRIQEWPSIKDLSANPFVYEGKTVAIVVNFEEMTSPTVGLFMSGSEIIVVSNIPKGFFRSKSKVLLVGRVLGKAVVKLPLLGEASLPHLKFVGAHFCKYEACNEVLREKK
ncbi:MAG: hypothetical protein ABIH76_05460 [Candidatus Bathyarchaeota archaeon]